MGKQIGLFSSTGRLSMKLNKYLCWSFVFQHIHILTMNVRRLATKFAADAAVIRDIKTKTDYEKLH